MNNAFTFKATSMKYGFLLMFFSLFYSVSQAQSISFSLNQGIQFEKNKEMQSNRYTLDMSNYANAIDLEAYAHALHSPSTAIFYDPQTHIYTVRIERRMNSTWISNDWNNHLEELHLKATNN